MPHKYEFLVSSGHDHLLAELFHKDSSSLARIQCNNTIPFFLQRPMIVTVSRPHLQSVHLGGMLWH